MAKRSFDVNQLAADILRAAIGEPERPTKLSSRKRRKGPKRIKSTRRKSR